MAAKARASAVPHAADRVLVITRVFDAPRRLVFEAWTKPEHLERWSSPHGFTIPACEGRLRPGGQWTASMRGPDGSEYRLGGVYREIIEDELLVFTHAWEEKDGRRGHETVVTVRFTDHGSGTKITLHQAYFETTSARDGHEGGWSESLDKLSKHLAALRAAAKSI